MTGKIDERGRVLPTSKEDDMAFTSWLGYTIPGLPVMETVSDLEIVPAGEVPATVKL